MSNVGSLENSGIEFSINSKPVVTTDWTWDLGFNITYNKNEITKLTTGDSENYYVAAGDNIGGGRDMNNICIILSVIKTLPETISVADVI